MTFTQHVEACTEPGHLDCTVIWCNADVDLPDGNGGVHPAGRVLWHSHWPKAVHAEHRINPDHPALDHRPGAPVPLVHTAPCAACAPLMPGQEAP